MVPAGPMVLAATEDTGWLLTMLPGNICKTAGLGELTLRGGERSACPGELTGERAARSGAVGLLTVGNTTGPATSTKVMRACSPAAVMACCGDGGKILARCDRVGTSGTAPSAIAGFGGVADMSARSSFGHVSRRCTTKGDLSARSGGGQASCCWLSRPDALKGDLEDATPCLGELPGTTGIGAGSRLVGQTNDIVKFAGRINLHDSVCETGCKSAWPKAGTLPEADRIGTTN